MSYVLIRVHSFSCDQPYCPEAEEYQTPTVAEARELARRAGWIILTNGRCWCPEHARQP